ncbi:MAG: RsmB/NOP family class I SAM-dependent RNA methyltransferase [archaeon]
MLNPKPELRNRIEKLLGKEADKFWEVCEEPPRAIIRVNTLKITPEDLKKRLKWKISTIKDFPEAIVIETIYEPGALGKSLEHQTGLYYVQELSSMMSPLALDPKPGETVLDLCAAPGSKTTQMAAMMKNKGLLIANDPQMNRLRALSTNLERCGVTNTIITRMNGATLCEKLAKRNMFFDKILLDAPCSGEGVMRSDPNVCTMWNPNMIKKIAGLQKKLMASALKCLKKGGILVYSTCTLEIEENEGVVQFALDKFPVELVEFKLPIKTRGGFGISKVKRIWPQDNDTEGFFVAKLRKK